MGRQIQMETELQDCNPVRYKLSDTLSQHVELDVGFFSHHLFSRRKNEYTYYTSYVKKVENSYYVTGQRVQGRT